MLDFELHRVNGRDQGVPLGRQVQTLKAKVGLSGKSEVRPLEVRGDSSDRGKAEPGPRKSPAASGWNPRSDLCPGQEHWLLGLGGKVTFPHFTSQERDLVKCSEAGTHSKARAPADSESIRVHWEDNTLHSP